MQASQPWNGLILTTITLVGSLLAVGSLHVAPTFAQQQAVQALDDPEGKPTVALLNPDGLPVGEDLFAALRDDTNAIWDRREDPDSIPAAEEIKPEAAEQVVAPADVLVILHAVLTDNRKTAIQMVVCETRHGVRLGSARIPPSLDSREHVHLLVDTVRQAMLKFKQKVVAVVGVPPFQDETLARRVGLPKWSCPELIEQILLPQEGVFLVELSEAYAIAQELERAGRRAAVARPRPHYVFGRKRVWGVDGRTQFAVDYEIVHGGQTLVETSQTSDTIEDAIRLAYQAGIEAVPQLLEPAKADPKGEVKLLADRAEQLAGKAQWEAAWGVAEAALLLDPDRHDVRYVVAKAIGPLVARYWQGGRTMAEQPEIAARGLNLYRRGLRQLDLFLESITQPEPMVYRYPNDLRGAGFVSVNLERSQAGDFIKQRLEQVKEEELAALLRITRHRAKVKSYDVRNFFGWAVFHMPAKKKWKVVEEAILDCQDLPDADKLTETLATHGYAVNVLDPPEARRMLANLRAQGNDQVKAAAQRLEEKLANWKPATYPSDLPRRVRPQPEGPPEVVFRPLGLKVDDMRGFPREFVGDVVAVGKGIDVFCGKGLVAVMKQKGTLKPIWRPIDGCRFYNRVNGSWPVGRPCFDGRYVWACATFLNRGPVLLLVDPATEKVWEMSATDGLPLPGQGPLHGGNRAILAMAPVAPGRVCIACKTDTTWLAMVDFDPQQGLSFNVFHEAREVIDPPKPDQWQSPNQSFTPMYMFMLTDRPDEDGLRQRLLFVGRLGDTRGWRYPLTVNPDTLAVDVMTKCEFRPGPDSKFGIHEGAVYWTYPHWTGGDHVNNPALLRTGFPDFRLREVARDFYQGRCQAQAVLFFNSQVHVVSNDWRVAPAVDKPFRELRGEVPDARGVTAQVFFRSNHYGLILAGESRGRLYQVEFALERRADQ